ncbi:hypothetical protein [Absidia glauca]|uniref:GDP/GTP exchange factor Sec2 N-terminal domain-containing protein n=1 Tax=Absidia glauca TaxID=4829 RepID=A0A163J6X5_ABSGL|nr:hypothetical protein [Absidia glauca]
MNSTEDTIPTSPAVNSMATDGTNEASPIDDDDDDDNDNDNDASHQHSHIETDTVSMATSTMNGTSTVDIANGAQTVTATTSDSLSTNTDSLVTGPRDTMIPAASPYPSSNCPCYTIVALEDTRQCGLCGRSIPIVDDLLKECDTQEQDIQALQQRLDEGQRRIATQTDDISQLQMTVERTKKELDGTTHAFDALQIDMEQLNDKYVDEIDRVAEMQYSKDMVENELEDLSQRLFEEANGMVANEKREKHNLKVTLKHLENQLEETCDRLAAEQMQLEELRLKMEAMQYLENNHDTSNRNSDAIFIDNNNNSSSSSSKRSSNGLTDVLNGLGSNGLAGVSQDDQVADKDSWPDMDTMLLDEFVEFVNLRTSVPLKKLHTIPFMKHCQLEDVDPCLRFGGNSRLSARKMNEAIVMNTCFIEDAPYGFAEEQAKRPVDMPLKISAGKTMIWERFSSSGQGGVFAGCQACGRTNDAASLPYRVRISYFDDWACIDRYCRDRLVAVCEFYVFIRNVRQGYYSTRTIIDLYQEAMRLRLQMFYARMGALPWTIRSLGITGDKIGSATSPKFEIPGPPFSESSPLPRKEDPLHGDNKRGGSLDEHVMQEQQIAITTPIAATRKSSDEEV